MRYMGTTRRTNEHNFPSCNVTNGRAVTAATLGGLVLIRGRATRRVSALLDDVGLSSCDVVVDRWAHDVASLGSHAFVALTNLPLVRVVAHAIVARIVRWRVSAEVNCGFDARAADLDDWRRTALDILCCKVCAHSERTSNIVTEHWRAPDVDLLVDVQRAVAKTCGALAVQPRTYAGRNGDEDKRAKLHCCDDWDSLAKVQVIRKALEPVYERT